MFLIAVSRNIQPHNSRLERNPEDMTIQLLREVLEEMGEHYSKSWKKIQLIQRVRDAREKQNLTVCHTTCTSASVFTTTTATASQQNTGFSEDIDTAKTIFTCSYEHETDSSFPRTPHRVGSTTVLYYYDEENERIIFFFFLLFILGMISVYGQLNLLCDHCTYVNYCFSFN